MDKSFVSKLFLIVLLAALILLLRLFWVFISAMILALLIASVFYPLYSRLKNLLRGEGRSASLLMTLLVFLVLVIPVGGFVGSLSNEAFDFFDTSRSSLSLKKIPYGLISSEKPENWQESSSALKPLSNCLPQWEGTWGSIYLNRSAPWRPTCSVF